MRDSSNTPTPESRFVTPPSITLHVIPPPAPLDWSTPSTLLRSVAWNYALQKIKPPQHYIGHINVELHSSEGRRIHVGQTSDKDLRYEMNVLGNRMNVQEMILEPQPGRLLSPSEIQSEHAERFREGTIASMKFLVNDLTFSVMTDFLRRYVTLGMHERFGTLDTDPLSGEPAGCSSFAIAFLRLAGLLDPSFIRHWRREMHVSPELLERDSSPKFWSLITMDAYEWAEPGENRGRDLEFWDPELMFNWIKDITKGDRTYERQFRQTKLGQANILEVDRRDAILFDGLKAEEIACLRNHYRLPLDDYETREASQRIAHELSTIS